jgi:hypothetical protein
VTDNSGPARIAFSSPQKSPRSSLFRSHIHPNTMTTKKNLVKNSAQPVKAVPAKKAGTKASAAPASARAAATKSAAKKAAATTSNKKASAPKLTGYEGLSVKEMCARFELASRELAVGQGKDAVAYRKYLADIFYFSYELSQASLGSSDDLDIGQAQVSDELDGSPFRTLLDRVSEGLSMEDADTLSTSLRREEVRLAFLLK